jgi:serine/threonine-protein kinase
MGKPSYMFPEQIEGKKVDVRTDLFSLGIVMYEALTGQRPFKGENIESIIGRILAEEPKAVTEIKPVMPYTL